ncbi:MAG TPA: hypothetical protein VGP65_09445 [Candidatus Angelobacter sp.]|nr:hypothetical protein [Candidatus Angelobacter sp.]
MRTKILWSVLIAMMFLVLGCRSDKASEKQSAANQQQASPTPPNDTAAQPSPSPQSEAVEKPEPKPALKPRSEASPATESQGTADTPTPTPTPTPEPTPVVVPAGTDLSIRTTSPIGTNSSQGNQEFEASVAKPVLSENEVVIPKGAPVKGAILKSESAGRIKGEGALILQLTSLTLQGKPYRIVTDHAMQQAKSRGKRSAAMIGGGGAGGALIGGLTGGGKGAAIGALAGAAAGTAGATLTGKRDMVIPAETILDFKLTAPLTLPPRHTSEEVSRPPDNSSSGQPEKGSQPSSTPPPQ